MRGVERARADARPRKPTPLASQRQERPRSRANALQRHCRCGLVVLALCASAHPFVDDGASCPDDCGVYRSPQRGYCDARQLSTCRCVDGFEGWDCASRSCPAARAWFGAPEQPATTGAAASHTRSVAVCGARGTCAAASGQCVCASDFEGAACQRSRCPASASVVAAGAAAGSAAPRYAPCTGHGRCASMRAAGRSVRGPPGSRGAVAVQAAAAYPFMQLLLAPMDPGPTSSVATQPFPVDYDEWEADRLFGCICDAGFVGTACDLRCCPLGTDPLFRGAPDTQELAVLLPGDAGVPKVPAVGEAALDAYGDRGAVSPPPPLPRPPRATSRPGLPLFDPPGREVQRVRITATGAANGRDYGTGGYADIDEVQVVTLAAVGARPVGSFTLALDCRPPGTFETSYADVFGGPQTSGGFHAASPSVIPSASASASVPGSLSVSGSASPSGSPSASYLSSVSPSGSASATASNSSSRSASGSHSHSGSASASLTGAASRSRSATPSNTASMSDTPTVTPSNSPSASVSASALPADDDGTGDALAPSKSVSPTSAASATASASASGSPSASSQPADDDGSLAGLAPSKSPSPSPSASVSSSASASLSLGASPSSTASASFSASASASLTSVASATASRTNWTQWGVSTSPTGSPNASAHVFTPRPTARSAVPGCLHWGAARRILGQTHAVVMPNATTTEAAAALELADAVRAALEALPSINAPGQVTVSAAASGGRGNGTCFELRITFSGVLVGGNLPLMRLDATGVSAPGGAMEATRIATAQDGSDIVGTLHLTWDDAESFPNSATFAAPARNCTGDATDAAALAPQGPRSAYIDMGSEPADIEDALVRLVFACAPAPAPLWAPAGAGAADWRAWPSMAAFAAAAAAPPCVEAPPLPWDATDSAGGSPAVRVELASMLGGGPDLEFSVQFLRGVRARGDVAPLRLSLWGTTLALASPTVFVAGGGVSVTVDELRKGEFIDPASAWSFAAPFREADGASVGYSPPLGPFPWCADAALVQAALVAYEFLGIGLVAVSRVRVGRVWAAPASSDLADDSRLGVPDDASSDWRGQYAWRVTFLSLAEDVPMLQALEGSVLVRGGSSTARGEQGIVAVRKVQAGSPAAPTSEVQLIDCSCPDAAAAAAAQAGDDASADDDDWGDSGTGGLGADGRNGTGGGVGACSDPARHFVRLTFRGATTAPIPYSARAEQVRAALAALPTIPDVIVRMYARERMLAWGGSVPGAASLAMCDAEGVTTAITFAWNPGPQEALTIRDPEADYALPPAADFVLLRTPSVGRFGGRARGGTHRLEPCSGRGACSVDGACQCFGAGAAPQFGPSDNGAWPDAAPGSAGGSVPPAEIVPNCGTPLPFAPVSSCPGLTTPAHAGFSPPLLQDGAAGECNLAGTCSGAPLWACTCATGFAGAACSTAVHLCGSGPAWFDVPGRGGGGFAGAAAGAAPGLPTAHRATRCSARGECVEGKCSCVGRWAGRGCDLSPCPGADSLAANPAVTPALFNASAAAYRRNSSTSDCGQHMPCVTMQTLARGPLSEALAHDAAAEAGVAVGAGDAAEALLAAGAALGAGGVAAEDLAAPLLVLDLVLRPNAPNTAFLDCGQSAACLGAALSAALAAGLQLPAGAVMLSALLQGPTLAQVAVPFDMRANAAAFEGEGLGAGGDGDGAAIAAWGAPRIAALQASGFDLGALLAPLPGPPNSWVAARFLMLTRRALQPRAALGGAEPPPLAQRVADALSGAEVSARFVESGEAALLPTLTALWAGALGLTAAQADGAASAGGAIADEGGAALAAAGVTAGFGLSGPALRPPTAAELDQAAAAALEADAVPPGGLLYDAWDAAMLRGCACGAYRLRSAGGHALNLASPSASFDCALFACPSGPDPQAAAAARDALRDVQTVRCALSAGRLRFALQGAWTRWLRFDASVADADTPADEYAEGGVNFESALRQVNTSLPFAVSWDAEAEAQADAGTTRSGHRRLCDAQGRYAFAVTFLTAGGPAPQPLEVQLDEAAAAAGGSVTVEVRSAADASANFECNRRGVCDRATGSCRCVPQFGSSDGRGGSGQLGDCGCKNNFFGLQRALPPSLAQQTAAAAAAG